MSSVAFERSLKTLNARTGVRESRRGADSEALKEKKVNVNLLSSMMKAYVKAGVFEACVFFPLESNFGCRFQNGKGVLWFPFKMPENNRPFSVSYLPEAFDLLTFWFPWVHFDPFWIPLSFLVAPNGYHRVFPDPLAGGQPESGRAVHAGGPGGRTQKTR